MEPYLDLSGRSGVVAFQIGESYIKIQFRNNRRVYVYSSRRINSDKIEHMKRLAVSGAGLNTFINQNSDVRYGFELE